MKGDFRRGGQKESLRALCDVNKDQFVNRLKTRGGLLNRAATSLLVARELAESALSTTLLYPLCFIALALRR